MSKLLTIVPFYPGDAAQAVAMLDWMADQSGQQNRTVILAHEELTPSDDVRRAASRAFTTVEHLLVTKCEDGWPISANCYFACIAAAMRGRAPWLLLEPDCVTVHPKALDMIEADYARVGRPCIGTIIPAYFRKNGVWTEVGKMLAGVAVYHANLWDHSPLLRSLMATQQAYAAQNKRNPQQKATPKAFDCYLAPEILPGAGETRLIQHMGKSREFRRDGGQIVCAYGPESRWNTVLQPETAIVHGCKDGSLIALLRAELGIPEGKGNAGHVAATIVTAAPAATRPVAGPAVWEDDIKTASSDPVTRPEITAASPAPFDGDASKTLSAVRESIRHWPDCKQSVFSLQVRKGTYRVVCQCGASSGKLPAGPDWEAVWNAVASQPAAAVVENPAYATATHEAGPAGVPVPRTDIDPATYFAQVRGMDATVHKFEEVKNRLAVSNVPIEQESGRIGPVIISATERLIQGIEEMGEKMASQTVIVDPGKSEIPLAKLRSRRDIVARFPELADLTPKAFRYRWLQLKKKDRDAQAKEDAKKLARASGRILTEAARNRKLELQTLGMGHRGNFLKLRRLAEERGITHTKRFKKDALIAAILEKEFAQPYEQFSEAAA